MSKYTPGPWVADRVRVGYSVMDAKCLGYVVQPSDDEGRYGTIMTEANARLIAAAPELLEALMELVDEAEMGGSSRAQWDAMRDRARAAITKATGDTQ